MVDMCCITYDSEVEDAFNVHTDNRVIKFEQTTEGLYAYTPTEKYMKTVAEAKNMKPPARKGTSFLVATVEENRKGFTQRQFDDAKRARRLYHIVGCPTVENFKHILRQNIIKNCPVTVEDVNNAERIFGPDIGALKGKTTLKQPIRVKDDLVEIPRELVEKNQKVIYCMDIMFMNGMPMLTGIDRSVQFRSLVPLDDRTAKELYRGLDKVLRRYNDNEYNVERINCDQEFKVLMEPVKDNLDVTMNYTTMDEHRPEAERNNRTIVECIRTTYHNLPYKAMPKVMLRYLAMISTRQLNLFPSKGGVLKYWSPTF
jgi:hypothetical protein